MNQALAENQDIAQRLREAADLLEAQGANPYRVTAYRKAAGTVADLPRAVHEIFDAQGVAGLEALHHIGTSIAGAIAEMLITGRWTQLERLRGTVDTTHLFQTIPGVGAELAGRLHDKLGVDTLEALENACHEGRLAGIPGIGPRRAAAIRDSVTAMLDRSRRRRRTAGAESVAEPAVGVLLDIDRRYRRQAQAHELPTIAPKRFNPEHAAWLPVLHATKDGWHFTALYSNTARAHELDRVFDWVVVYFQQDHSTEGQRTVVTETHGILSGRRVVRGRERECSDWYATQPVARLKPAAQE
jgi:DNA polymerase (family 10)